MGVLDKMDSFWAVSNREALSLADLSATTGLPRPPHIGWRRTGSCATCAGTVGTLAWGPRLVELASSGGEDWLGTALPILTSLRDATSESAQLYQRRAIAVCASPPLSGRPDCAIRCRPEPCFR